LTVVAIGALLPASPVGPALGFSPLPFGFFAALVAMVVAYLVLIELGKTIFYRTARTQSLGQRAASRARHLRRRSAQFSTSTAAPPLRTDYSQSLFRAA
jgi:P-type Mg2+ transporter